jgi:hypothetical protein
MLHHHVSIIRAEGARVNWQKEQSKPRSNSQPTVVERLIADHSVLEVPYDSPKALCGSFFTTLNSETWVGTVNRFFAARLDNPFPHGPLQVSGRFGPWNSSAPKRTALDGEYTLHDADLGVFPSIAGMVSSQGRFSGTFDNLAVQGQTSTPELTVVSTHHGLPLQTNFLTRVNGAAQFGKDELEVHGSIARYRNARRVASLEIQCDRGRIEDTFYPFIHNSRAAVTGAVRFRMHVTIPSGKQKFQKKLGLTSTFEIENAHFTHEQTQLNLSKIAQAPHQEQPDITAPASLRKMVWRDFPSYRWRTRMPAQIFAENLGYSINVSICMAS